jgi:hypothetical protein
VASWHGKSSRQGGFGYQLKSRKSRIGDRITDGAYAAMMNAIRQDPTSATLRIGWARTKSLRPTPTETQGAKQAKAQQDHASGFWNWNDVQADLGHFEIHVVRETVGPAFPGAVDLQ